MEKNKSNIKNTWSVLNKLIKKGNQNADIPTEFLTNDRTLINQPNEIVNQFNQYFTNIGPKLAKEIVNTNQVDALSKIPTTDKTIFIQATDENEIISVVKNCKTKTSADWNGLDMSVLKDIIECVVKPISYIFNLSLQSGVFPEKMKMAKVMPIHKAGDKHEFTHYRPISILSQFSKILEKIFHKRLFSYVDKQSILCEQQYGFRPNRTTTLALVDLVEKISNAIDNKQYAVGVFLDLTKAFDTVNHELLLQKLYRYGMRGVAFSWLQTYLKNRSQYVHINGTDSQLLTVTCGLPQGAVLGPFLFLMYINDLCLVSKTLNLILFADDTNMLSCGKNLETLIDIVEKQLFLLKKWFDSNKLTLNLNKTKCIVFGNRAIDVHRNVIINDTEIERVNEITFLGVLLQNKLSWKPHINHIKAKLCKSLAIISKVKELLNEKNVYILYCSLVLPYMTYGLEVWGNTYKTNLNPITIIQKRAIRIVNKVAYREHTNELFIKLKALKLKDLVDFKTAQFMYNISHNKLPVHIQGLFQKRDCGYNFRKEEMFKKTYVRTSAKQHCVSFVGINVWSKLGQEQKDCKTLIQFKTLLKISFIKTYVENGC